MKKLLVLTGTLIASLMTIAADPKPEGGPYKETVEGIEWTFFVTNGEACVGTGKASAAVPTATQGAITVPSVLGERPVTGIGNSAFSMCTGLTGVTIPEGVTSLGHTLFYLNGLITELSIPVSATNIAEGAFYACFALQDIHVAEGNQHYTSPDGVLYDKDGTSLVCCPAAKTSVSLLTSVTNVCAMAFGECRDMESITLPPHLATLGNLAFYSCQKITELTFPSSVVKVGGNMFPGCTSLDTFYFKGPPPKGVENAGFETDAIIKYNVAYAIEWLPVVEQCGWTNATPYVPGPGPVGDEIEIAFVVPNGVCSVSVATYATNAVYGRLPEAKREGCTFAGWYTSLDGTTRVGAFDDVLPDVKTLYARWVEDETPLFAQWDPNHYSAVFNAGGGTGAMAAQPFIYDQTQALSSNAFKKTGYAFKGWATNEAGEVVYADKQAVSNLTAEAGFAVALFAKWEQLMDITEEEIEEWVVYDLAPTFRKPGETAIGYVNRFKARFGDDYTTAFYSETGKTGQDGEALCVYHDYIAGTDPLDKNSQFKANITFDASGKPVVTYEPVLAEEKAAQRIYTTHGKQNLTDEWSVVAPGQEADYRFFKVTVEMK